MKEVVELSDFEALRAHLVESWPEAAHATVEVKPYKFDWRIGWNTYIVCINGDAVGYTNALVGEVS